MSIREKIFLIIFLPITIFLFVVLVEQIYEYTEYKKYEIVEKKKVVIQEEIKPKLLILTPEKTK